MRLGKSEKVDPNYGCYKARRVLRYLIKTYRFYSPLSGGGYLWQDEDHLDAALAIARIWQWVGVVLGK